MSTTNIFAEKLSEAMSIRKMSQAELSRITGISKSAISQYLSGRSIPKNKYIEILADALEVNMYWLIGDDDIMQLSELAKANNDLALRFQERIKLIEKIYNFSCRITLDGLKIAASFLEFLHENYNSDHNIISPFITDEEEYSRKKGFEEELKKLIEEDGEEAFYTQLDKYLANHGYKKE